MPFASIKKEESALLHRLLTNNEGNTCYKGFPLRELENTRHQIVLSETYPVCQVFVFISTHNVLDLLTGLKLSASFIALAIILPKYKSPEIITAREKIIKTMKISISASF